MEIRGVQGAGVLKTLLDRKLIATAGRKNVIGKPILYRTSKEFMIQFGLKDLAELPSLKEFEDIRRMALSDDAPAEAPADASAEAPASAPGEGPAGDATALSRSRLGDPPSVEAAEDADAAQPAPGSEDGIEKS
jgi:segregation and condensation protein B